MGEQQRVSQTEQDLSHVLKTYRGKLTKLQAAGKNPSRITKYDVTAHNMDVRDNYQQWEEKKVVIAGRMMFKRVMGKTSFCSIRDLQGTIQIYAVRDSIGEEPYKDFKEMDIGNIVGVRRTVLTTKAGEISTHTAEVIPLTKSLRVLPEKLYGLTDTDTRYRQRYADLIISAEVKDTFIERSKIISAICTYLSGQGSIKVRAPMLVVSTGGAAVRPFEAHSNMLDEDLKMRIPLELYPKRLIIGGLERVYETGHVFRDEGSNTHHNPEFALMELYQAYTDYDDMMELKGNLYRHVARAVLGATTIAYKGVGTDLGRPFARITTVEAIKKYAGVDFDEIHTLEEARVIAKEKGVGFEARHKEGDILNLFFEEFTKEHLVQPTFVLDHPVEMSPLTKKKPGNPGCAERFEFFMDGWGMANTYSEINSPIDQRERFKAQEELLAQGDEEANHTDEDFLNVLEVGMPPTGGIRFGIDRMVTLLTDSSATGDVLLFPIVKTIGGGEPSKKAEKTDVAAELSVKTEEAAAPVDSSKVKIEPLSKKMVGFRTFTKSNYHAVEIKDCVAMPKNKRLLQFTSNDGSGTDRTTLSGVRGYYEPGQLIGETAITIVGLPPGRVMGIDSCGMLTSTVHEEGGHEGLNLLMVDGRVPASAKLY